MGIKYVEKHDFCNDRFDIFVKDSFKFAAQLTTILSVERLYLVISDDLNRKKGFKNDVIGGGQIAVALEEGMILHKKSFRLMATFFSYQYFAYGMFILFLDFKLFSSFFFFLFFSF